MISRIFSMTNQRTKLLLNISATLAVGYFISPLLQTAKAIEVPTLPNQTQAMPAPLLHLDSYFTHHILVAEKATHTLYLFRNNDSYPELVKSYHMATGERSGDKLFEGDYRTPEGTFFFTEFLPHQQLVDNFGDEGLIYGVGAFVMNYPNPVDRIRQKTGGGIWLHSTNDETRIDKGLDSRGCIVTANKHLVDISKHIELERTMIVVVENLNWLSQQAWLNKRNKLLETVEDWRVSWEEQNIPNYISFYHKDKFHDARHGGIEGFTRFKRAIFSRPGNPEVNITDLSLIVANNYAKVNFRQDYRAPNLTDIGRKTLYMVQDTYYDWKIVSENWTKRGIKNEEEKSEQLAFKPSLRFFQSSELDEIMPIFTASQETN